MIDTLLNLVFRCAHRRLTRPVTPVSKGDSPNVGTYVVCLDCGKQFAYDPKEMRLGKAIDTTQESQMVVRPEMSAGARIKHTLAAAVPATVIFFLALFGIKQRSKR